MSTLSLLLSRIGSSLFPVYPNRRLWFRLLIYLAAAAGATILALCIVDQSLAPLILVGQFSLLAVTALFTFVLFILAGLTYASIIHKRSLSRFPRN